MTTQELIELALLDAVALLDDEEREAFETAFRAAAPGIQAQVRREQTRLSRLDGLLPDVEPPIGLRAAVLERIREAMKAGRNQRVVRDLPSLAPSRGVSPVWRTASLGCLAAAVVFALTTLQLRGQYTSLASVLSNDRLLEQILDSFDVRFEEALFNPNIEHVVFERPDTSEAGAFRAEAVLLLDPTSGTAFLVCQNLPMGDDKTYDLVVVNDEGEVEERLARIEATGRLVGKPIKVRVGVNTKLQIKDSTNNSDDGGPLLATQIGPMS